MILKKSFPVNKSSFYELAITLDTVGEYKKGIIKIINDLNNNPIFLPIKLPNSIFSVNSNDRSYLIHFDTPHEEIDTVTMYILGLDISTISISSISNEQMISRINLTRLRQLHEIEFTKYYLDLFNNCSDKKLDQKLVQKINDEYSIFKNPSYFDNFVKNDLVNDPSCKKLESQKHIIGKTHSKNIILFLTSTIHDESSSTNRIKSIIKTINFDNNKYHGILCTRYGYPYDHSEDYYNKKLLLTKIDGIDYIPLWQGKCNYNTNTIRTYIEKYIIELYKVCIVNSVSIIHVQNNYINGLVAGYVAKSLGI